MLLVVATLVAVAIFALAFKPRGFFGHWKRLADQFEITRQPNAYSFANQSIFVGWLSEPGWFWFPWQRRYWQMDDGEYAYFDVECDNEGLWLRHKGDTQAKCPEHMLIPWPYISVRKKYSNQIVFQVATDYFVDFRMEKELGDVCLEYLRSPIRAA